MAKKENIRRGPQDLFTYSDGTDAINDREWNAGGNPICIVPGCTMAAHNRGKNHGGFAKKCKQHLNLVGKNSYKRHKEKVTYCENIDGRLGIPCTSTISDLCMLGVDHVDEDHDNNSKDNLQTLCACCDRYKTNKIGKKVQSKKLSVAQMLDYFEINKKIKKGTHEFADTMRLNVYAEILEIK